MPQENIVKCSVAANDSHQFEIERYFGLCESDDDGFPIWLMMSEEISIRPDWTYRLMFEDGSRDKDISPKPSGGHRRHHGNDYHSYLLVAVKPEAEAEA